MTASDRFGWRAALRIAWRESRASRAKFLFVILAVAAGVGSLAGVRGFSRAFRNMLLRDARTLMAADLSARIFGLPAEAQRGVLERLENRGVRRTWITETLTMAASAHVREPLLISVKAVDSKVYPFYGAVKLDPPGELAARLTRDTVAVSEDLPMRLHVSTGDSLRLGGQDFRITGVLVSEPDRMTGSLNVGPRVMITREGLERTGLIGIGSRASERFLFKLPAGGRPSVDEVRGILKRAFPEAMIADFRETHPVITRGLNRATMFLSLVSLIALIVGALGVATAMHAHLQQKMDTIAVLKCLGARSGQVLRIYVAQTLLLGVAGSVAGIAVGIAIQRVFPLLIARYFPVAPETGWDFVTAAQALLIGILTTLLFTVPPLQAIRDVRPNVILRREVDQPARRSGRRRQIPAGAAIVVAIGLVAAWLTGAPPGEALRVGAYFAGGLCVSLLALAAAGWILLRGLRWFLATTRRTLPVTLRHGVANLYRPGNHAQAALVALGIGVTFTLAIFLIQHAMVSQLLSSAPPGMPNVFLLDIPGSQRQAVSALVAAQPGVKAAPEVTGSVAVRLVKVNGVPVERLPLQQFGRRFLRTNTVTSIAAKPEETEILSGAWWNPSLPPATPQVCLGEDAARILAVKPGMWMEWTAAGKPLQAQVACIERTDSVRLAARFQFLFSPGALDGFPAVYYGSLRVEPRRVAALQRAVYERFPTVTVINVADVLEIVQQVVEQIAIVVRFISGFAILAGVVILASSVAGTRFRRIREVVILKALGATRRRIASIFSVEFLLLGTVAGVMGSLLASGFAAVVLIRLLNTEYHFDALPAAAAIVLTALVANAAGWLASFRILGQKPLEILREE